MTRLHDDDVLVQIEGCQVVALGDDRLLVRHPRGAVVRNGPAAEDLARVRAAVDGTRTVAQISAALADRYEEADVRRVLDTLSDTLWRRRAQASPPEPAPPRLALWGEGAVVERLQAALTAYGYPAPDCLGAHQGADVSECDLLICAPHGMSLTACFHVQRRALKSGTPTLWLTGEAGEVVLGPPVLPGLTACLACVRMGAFLDLEPAATAGLGRLRTDLTGKGLDAALPVLTAMVHDLVQDRFEAYGHALVFGPDGRMRRRLHLPHAACPICRRAQTRPPASARGRAWAGRAVHAGQQLLRAFSASGSHAVRRPPPEVCVLGGGTAGYLAALAVRRHFPDTRVTLIQSSQVGVIGVGEATTPLLPQFLHNDLGLDLHGFWAEVRPTLKLGIAFHWGRAPFYYPFGAARLLEAAAYDGHLNRANLNAVLMGARKLPLVTDAVGTAGSWGAAPDTAYHVDSKRLAAYLARVARERGVRVLDRVIVRAHTDAARRTVTALEDAEGHLHTFPFFIDCSGFRALLLGETLGHGFRGYGKSLRTDHALVGAVPAEAEMRPYTTATAFEAGWCWDIPQRGERHVGYVFSSAYCDATQAEAALRAAYPDLGAVRLIPFQSGRRAVFAADNVAALGNAYGFVEPLESTSLHLVVRQIGLLLGALPTWDPAQIDDLNTRVAGWWDYLAWFLAIHYKYNTGMASLFWAACRAETATDHAAALLDRFRRTGPLSAQPDLQASFPYPDPLWGPEGVDTLLLGQGAATTLPVPRTGAAAWRRWCADAAGRVALCAGAEAALAACDAHASVRAGLAEIFAAAGPAFPRP